MIGSRLGPYQITAKVGEGGMGEVYRATDTKLERAAIYGLEESEVAGPSLSARRVDRGRTRGIDSGAEESQNDSK